MTSWKNGQSNIRGDTEDRRDLLHHQRSERRSSTFTEPGGRISCYSEFLLVAIYGCFRLRLGQSDSESPVGVDCKFGSEAADEGDSERQQLRIQKKICVGGASRQDQLVDEKGSRSGTLSAEDPGELLHRQTEEGEVIHSIAMERTNSRTVGKRTN